MTSVRAPKPAESARKVLELLMVFDEQRPTLTVAELARALNLPVSTAYRYVAILRDVGLIEQTTRGSYRVGERIFALSASARAASAPLLDVALPVMRRLRDEHDETVIIARRVGDVAVCMDIVEAQQPVRLSVTQGQPMRLHEGSAPRVLLAAMPAAERDAYLRRLAESGTTNLDRLDARNLERVAEEGWTESFEELSEGIWGTAAAVRDDTGVIASIGVAGPLFRLTADKRRSIADGVRRAAAEVAAGITSRR